jgi:hypothetical protein
MLVPDLRLGVPACSVKGPFDPTGRLTTTPFLFLVEEAVRHRFQLPRAVIWRGRCRRRHNAQ